MEHPPRRNDRHASRADVDLRIATVLASRVMKFGDYPLLDNLARCFRHCTARNNGGLLLQRSSLDYSRLACPRPRVARVLNEFFLPFTPDERSKLVKRRFFFVSGIKVGVGRPIIDVTPIIEYSEASVLPGNPEKLG